MGPCYSNKERTINSIDKKNQQKTKEKNLNNNNVLKGNENNKIENVEENKSNKNNDLAGNENNKKKEGKKLNDININEEKEKLVGLNKDIKDRFDYYDEINLNLAKYKSEINIDDDINDKEHTNHEIVKKKKETTKDLENQTNNETNNIETLLNQIQNKEEINAHTKIKKLENFSDNKDTIKSPENHSNNIIKEINPLVELNSKLKADYQNFKKQIEGSKKKIDNKLTQFKKEKENLNKIQKYIKAHIEDDEKFLNNSMFLFIKDPINQPLPADPKGEELLINNFNEKCYIFEEFDLYDRNFEYQAVGLPKRTFLGVEDIPLTKNRIIKIIEFTIDDKEIKYNYDDKNSTLKFDLINLKNLETKKIHLKYEQSRKLIEGQKKHRKIYIEDEYGISKNLKGRNAVFHLIIKNDMEIISFDKEIFIKVGEGDYKIEGLIPEEGKKTRVIISKKSAKYKVSYVKKIATKDNKNIKDTELKLHYYFEEGGNKKNEININKTTNPPYNIKNIDKENRQYEIKFFNINQNFAEVKIEGELINNCSGEWDCNLTEGQIEKEIPDDYKNNKEELKKIAQEIIKEYDEKHKNDSIEVMNIVKIGKWIKDNIKYDDNYKEDKPSTALDIYHKKLGVCKQFTILYNALLYSLGYQCIYVSGFAFKDDDTFKSSDAHSWSLVKIIDKWFPFDSTWGIFSGKLPACHIFEDYFLKSNIQTTKDNLDKKEDEVFGQFIE